jgi:hypothetical protein
MCWAGFLPSTSFDSCLAAGFLSSSLLSPNSAEISGLSSNRGLCLDGVVPSVIADGVSL